MPRMQILSSVEQVAFDKPPKLDHRERKQFFELSRALVDKAAKMRTTASKIGFLFMCGYFKATKRFYLPHDFHSRDIAAIANQLGLSGEAFTPERYTETTRLRHQRLVLEFYGFAPFSQKAPDAEAKENLRRAITAHAGFCRKVYVASGHGLGETRRSRILNELTE